MAAAIMAGADLPPGPCDPRRHRPRRQRPPLLSSRKRTSEKSGTDYAINYRALFTNAFDQGRFDGLTTQDLPKLWCDAYRRMTDAQMELVQVSDEGYQFIFDLRAERVVAAFGTARYNPARRDADRMKDFLGSVTSNQNLQRIRDAAPSSEVARQRQDMAQLSWRERFFRTYGHLYDRGHFRPPPRRRPRHQPVSSARQPSGRGPSASPIGRWKRVRRPSRRILRGRLGTTPNR
jgi:hypothetical protein